MLTRCQEQVHVFVDHDSQCTGPYVDADPLAALGQRWTRDARKTAVSDQLELQAGEAAPCEHALPPAEHRQHTAVVHRAWDSEVDFAELPWRTRGDAGPHTAMHPPDGVHRPAAPAEESWWSAAEQREQPEQPALEDGLGWELDL
jgi:hypothetical protein